MSGLAGVTLISDETQEESGALVPRNLGATGAGEGAGVFMRSLSAGSTVEAATANHVYALTYLGDGTAEISGHPQYCPEPVRVKLHGTKWLDRTLDNCYVAPGMQLQFVDPGGRSVLTSKIATVTLRTV